MKAMLEILRLSHTFVVLLFVLYCIMECVKCLHEKIQTASAEDVGAWPVLGALT